MTKPFFKTLAEGRKRLAEINVDPAGMTLREMSVTYQQQLKRNVTASKSDAPKASTAPKTNKLDDLKAAAKADRNPTTKIEKLEALRAAQLEALNSEKDLVKATDLRREFQRTDKSIALARLAEESLTPGAAKARRYMSQIDE
jgi:hypothetical protein